MYSAQPNGADSATINPAALSSELVNATSRGTKRSRSPDYPDLPHTGTAGDDEHRQKKRGRPMKKSISESPALPNIPQLAQPMQVPSQPPQAQNVPVPTPPQPAFVAPPQASPPPKTTPTKTTLKALPTVRDHTTDQLGPGGDEYLPREIDEAGEKKVMPNGQLLGGREYRCRTFLVPNRGDKLFMLATECARVLSYRDSYLLFNKNRSLFKIIASQEEKDDLVQQDILPFSYRSRQIAIVTARSMFRQFGSRVIQNGRRVRDDYWESKARKQGFTEADLAGEKRPGAAKAREEAAQAANAALLTAPHEIVYSTSTPHFGGPPQPQLIQPGMIGAPSGSAARMPMITLGPDLSDRRGDFSNLLKGGPRQEITGPPYHDRTQSAPLAEIQAQAGQAADYNRSVNQQREMRHDYMQNIWRRPHEQPASTAALSQPIGAGESTLPTTRPAPSTSSIPQSGMVPTQNTQIMMTAPPYSQPLHTQATAAPMRGMAPVSTPKSGRPTSLSSGTTGSLPQTSYNYGPSSQIWAPHQTTQTPQHGYSGYTTQAQASPHPPQSTTPQMRHASSAQVQPSMQFSGMPGMNQAYGSSAQNMYPTDQTPRQYMPSSASPAPAVTQGWTNPQTTAQWWTPQQQ